MLGGGIGHLTRGYGLSIDNILGAELVLADGSVVNADENENPDLYWAIRGGGGNFGVATKIRARLHPVDTVVAGPMFWPLDRAADVLRWYRDFILNAPEELGGWFAFLSVPPGAALPGGAAPAEGRRGRLVLDRAEDGADDALAEARAQEGLLLDGVAPVAVPVPSTARSTPSTRPATSGTGAPTSSTTIPDEAVEKHVEFAEKMPTWKSTMHMYPIDGAAHRVGPTDTPWALPQRELRLGHGRRRPRPGQRRRIRDWAVGYQEALHPYSAGGAYLNMIMDEGQDRVRASLRGELRPARQDQGEVRPGQPLPREPEHPAARVALLRRVSGAAGGLTASSGDGGGRIRTSVG